MKFRVNSNAFCSPNKIIFFFLFAHLCFLNSLCNGFKGRFGFLDVSYVILCPPSVTSQWESSTIAQPGSVHQSETGISTEKAVVTV